MVVGQQFAPPGRGPLVVQQVLRVQLGQRLGHDLERGVLADVVAEGAVDGLRAARAVNEQQHLGQGVGKDELPLAHLPRIAQQPHRLALMVDRLEVERSQAGVTHGASRRLGPASGADGREAERAEN